MADRMRKALASLTVLALAGLALPTLAAPATAAVPSVSDAWARATPPGVSVGAVYLTIIGGATDDRLIAASTDRASMVQLHTVEDSNGVAAMRQADGVAVPAGGKIVLAPGGTHIMLMGLDRPLVAGETFPLQLRFEKAGPQVVQVTVRAAGAPDAAGPAAR